MRIFLLVPRVEYGRQPARPFIAPIEVDLVRIERLEALERFIGSMAALTPLLPGETGE
jgi:hypothetical protein